MKENGLKISVGILHAPNIKYIECKDYFEIQDVEIGKGFHWQQKEHQRFRGKLRIIDDSNGGQWAVNDIGLEEYVESVICSEMRSTSNIELLKAHAVISRSWALRAIRRKLVGQSHKLISNKERLIWYDCDGHEQFDVCADDHCQRYQGITRITNKTALEAVAATQGEVLMYGDDEICDARFSKCCGGVTEVFESCWANEPHAYLRSQYDSINNASSLDLRNETAAKQWIESTPQCFCNCKDEKVIRQVLNDYDIKTTHNFFRWEESVDSIALSLRIKEKTDIDLGEILGFKVLERGPSARIIRLQIQGTKGALTVGKELEIRRILSNTHLRSSAFIVNRSNAGEFIFRGSGWGHGVGLCQIGASVMAEKGYSYQEILAHYYPGTRLSVLRTSSCSHE